VEAVVEVPSVSQTDAELLGSVRAGDRTAAETLARRHVGWAVDYARRRGAGDLAEDCAQTVLSNLVLRPPIELRAESARAYLTTCLDREVMRVHAPETLPPHESIVDPRTSPSSVVARRHLVGQALHALEDLPSHQHRLMVLRYVDGLEPAEIAVATGEPAGSVRKLLSRGLAALRVHRFFSP